MFSNISFPLIFTGLSALWLGWTLFQSRDDSSFGARGRNSVGSTGARGRNSVGSFHTLHDYTSVIQSSAFVLQGIICLVGFFESCCSTKSNAIYYALSDLHMIWLMPIVIMHWLVPVGSLETCLAIFAGTLASCVGCWAACQRSGKRDFIHGRLLSMCVTLGIVEYFGIFKNLAVWMSALLAAGDGDLKNGIPPAYHALEYLPGIIVYVVGIYFGTQRGNASALYVCIGIGNVMWWYGESKRAPFDDLVTLQTTLTSLLTGAVQKEEVQSGCFSWWQFPKVLA